MAYVMCQYRYFVCPIEYSETLGRMTMDCEPSSLFKPQEYTLPESLQTITKLVRYFLIKISFDLKNCFLFKKILFFVFFNKRKICFFTLRNDFFYIFN